MILGAGNGQPGRRVGGGRIVTLITSIPLSLKKIMLRSKFSFFELRRFFNPFYLLRTLSHIELRRNSTSDDFGVNII